MTNGKRYVAEIMYWDNDELFEFICNSNIENISDEELEKFFEEIE